MKVYVVVPVHPFEEYDSPVAVFVDRQSAIAWSQGESHECEDRDLEVFEMEVR